MSRTKQLPEDRAKHGKILQMAEKMFMTQGFSSVSMDALAEAVPVSKRTLYNHFKDKKALFTAVMQNRCQMVFNRLEQRLHEGGDAEQTLIAIGRQFLDKVLEPDAVNIYRIAIMEVQQFPELGKLFYEGGPRRTRAILADYFSALQEKGVLAIANPELAASVFLGMLINRVQMQCMLGVKKRVSAQEKDELVRYAVQVFLYGQQPQRP